MKISYNDLWLPYRQNMQKKDLNDKIGISSTTIAKMEKREKVSLNVIERICSYFDCDIGDIISFDRNSQNDQTTYKK